MNQNKNTYSKMTDEALKEAYKAARNSFHNATKMRKSANELYWMIEDMEQEMNRRGI